MTRNIVSEVTYMSRGTLPYYIYLPSPTSAQRYRSLRFWKWWHCTDEQMDALWTFDRFTGDFGRDE